ncbi:phage tail protein [Pectobacterium versatile]|uniref:phage tail-collar fiber domain-containing protein n=1 Tax=Pectobacterium versatile TaxID=2488639 RepID=UPI0020BF8F72|nr:phage tail protein [Pectobacterium versatile]
MSAKYLALLTNIGAARLANATALGNRLNISQMAVGDGGGVLPTPNPAQTALINETRRAALNSLSVDPKNPSQIIAEQVIPENEGGWWIREIGLFDDDGNLIAVANCPETYKPQLQEGSGRIQTVRMILIVSSTDAVTLKIDPAVVLATRGYVDDAVIEVKAYADNLMRLHLAAADPHPQYAPKVSPTLTGKPTAPTAAQASNDTQLATTAFVKSAISALVNGSPGALDTLQELAAALGNDPNFSATVLAELAKKLPLSGGKMSGRLETEGIIKVAGAGPVLPESQGAFLCWNRLNGNGRTDFVNHRGSGDGGFTFWNGNHEALSELASLNAAGALYISGMIHESGRRVYSPNNKPTPDDIGAYSKDEGDARYLRKSGGTLSGEIVSTAGNALRLVGGDYGVMLRNDGGDFYLLLTNKGDSNGSWNPLRPFRVRVDTGDIEMAHNVRVGGELMEKGQRVYSPNNKPTATEINAIAVNELAGIPQLFPGTTAPAGWLKCNGQAFDMSLYPVLASRYPSSVLPDLRGEFVRGWDDGRGVDAGRALLSYQSDELRAHTHSGVPLLRNDPDRGSGTSNFSVDDIGTTSATGGNETRPRNIAFNYIVRAA